MKHLLFILLLPLCLLSACTADNKAPHTDSHAPTLDVPRFDRDSAYAFVARQVAFGPRVPNSEPHAQCKAWLVGKFKSFGLEVIEQPFTATRWDGVKLSCTNIIARYRPELSKRILLAAHWDSRYQADSPLNEERRNEPILGADDGGSGVAVLLEIARQISQDSLQLGVDFVLFDAEDQGNDDDEKPQPETWCLGSQYWSRNLVPPAYRPMYGILLDMVGAANATFPKEGVSLAYASNVVEKVWSLAQRLGYGNYFVNTKGGSVTDDHYFVNTIAGIPMIDIIHKHANSQTGFGAHWHTHNDNLQIIHVRTLKAVGQTLLELLYREASNQPI